MEPTRRFPTAVLASLALAVLGLNACSDGSESPAERCRPGPGASGTPSSIDQALTLVNSLPRPVTVTCFLESLDRPLHATATHNTISLQPAAGSRSPRIFLLTDKLVMTVAVEGKGRDLVELGEFVSDTRTLKGEIAFPAVAELPPDEPYQRIQTHGPTPGIVGTTCRFCHGGEEPVRQVGGAVAYASDAFKPSPRSVVPLDDIRREQRTCKPAVEPDRCRFLDALLNHGDLLETAFPPQVPTFFQ